MKSISWALCAALLLMGSLARPMQAEEPGTWSCTWKGTWIEPGMDAPSPISLAGFMYAADGGLVMRANGKDELGPSRVRGGCGDGECWVEQKYASGQLRGTSYYFSLKEKSSPLLQGVKNFSYSGTWGDQEEVSTHSGTIQLTASCRPFSYGTGEQVYTRMEQILGWKDDAY